MVTLTLLDPNTRDPLQQWNFPNQVRIRIGRASDNDIVLSHFLEVSRHHLELKQVSHASPPTHWQLTSHGTNGTFLNGMLVSQSLIANESSIQLAKDGPVLQFQVTRPLARKNSCCTPENNPANSLFCVHCGQPLVEQEQFVRHYQILKTLGRGGMGTTYLAWDRAGSGTGQPQTLVLKEMNADMAKIAKAQELFEREARILKSLNHPGIPKYYDFFIEEGKKYLAMELIHGQNLEARIYQRGPVTPQQGIEWMIQTCEILNYLHTLHPPLAHRDVKPANLMVRHLDSRIILLDFGAVKEIGTPLGTRIGAEGYSAPEQDRGQSCPQSDLYAIAPTLTFLLAGETPLKHYRYQGNFYRLDVAGIPTISPALRQVIEKASDPRLKQRYQTATELSRDLRSCLLPL